MANVNMSKLVVPSIVGVGAYLLHKQIFPEELKSFDKDIRTGLRGGGSTTETFWKIVHKLSTDRALKIALLAIFGTTAIQYFQAEIEALLIDDIFSKVCVRDVKGNLKIVCDIVKEHDLHLHTQPMRDIIISESLSNEDKISLLKIKLDFIINGGCKGKIRFLVMTILALIVALTISGSGGLALLLEALHRLFREGRISKAMYHEIVNAIVNPNPWGVKN